MTGSSGNSKFCFPETFGRGETKLSVRASHLVLIVIPGTRSETIIEIYTREFQLNLRKSVQIFLGPVAYPVFSFSFWKKNEKNYFALTPDQTSIKQNFL